MKWFASDSAAANARRVLPKLAREFFKLGRDLRQDSSAEEFHSFRLKTKHLRYTLEIFAPFYSATGLKARLERIRPIQNALGDLNDCEVFLAEFKGRLDHHTLHEIEKRGEEKRQEFLRYWREEFDAPGEDEKWDRYLTRYARPPKTQDPS